MREQVVLIGGPGAESTGECPVYSFRKLGDGRETRCGTSAVALDWEQF